jgi:attachment p12 family protein
MMTAIGGIALAALLFGLFATLRPSDRSGKVGCAGDCGACSNDGACDSKGASV